MVSPLCGVGTWVLFSLVSSVSFCFEGRFVGGIAGVCRVRLGWP